MFLSICGIIFKPFQVVPVGFSHIWHYGISKYVFEADVDTTAINCFIHIINTRSKTEILLIVYPHYAIVNYSVR